jgi:hypothetical protein
LGGRIPIPVPGHYGPDNSYRLLEEWCYVLSTSAVSHLRAPLVSFVPTLGRSEGSNQKPIVAVIHTRGNLIPLTKGVQWPGTGPSPWVALPQFERKKRRSRRSKNHRVEYPRRKTSTLILPPSFQNPQLRNKKTTLICRLLTRSVRNSYAFGVSRQGETRKTSCYASSEKVPKCPSVNWCLKNKTPVQG